MGDTGLSAFGRQFVPEADLGRVGLVTQATTIASIAPEHRIGDPADPVCSSAPKSTGV
ncbi:MAG TPA: hypothetical protein VFX45_12090 [Solirubrobacterales bacterium]|nr:hypothetical protein [Solirubrobacterales bacterium]